MAGAHRVVRDQHAPETPQPSLMESSRLATVFFGLIGGEGNNVAAPGQWIKRRNGQCFVARMKRNAGTAFPDCAALHPGYGALRASWMSCQMRGGVSGNWRGSTRSGRNAAATALATA